MGKCGNSYTYPFFNLLFLCFYGTFFFWKNSRRDYRGFVHGVVVLGFVLCFHVLHVCYKNTLSNTATKTGTTCLLVFYNLSCTLSQDCWLRSHCCSRIGNNVLHTTDISWSIYLQVDDLVPHQPLWEVVQDLPRRADPTHETCATADHAPYTAPTRHHGLKDTDRSIQLPWNISSTWWTVRTIYFGGW